MNEEEDIGPPPAWRPTREPLRVSLAPAEELDVGMMPGLNARAIALLGGPGAGKTETLAAFYDAPGVRVLGIDPAGQLAKRVSVRDDVTCISLPRDWKERSTLIPKVVGLLRPQGAKVCVSIPPTAYAEASAFVDALCTALMESGIMDLLLLLEECQRYLGQNREGLSYAALATIEMGRNWNWGRVMATQRPAELIKGGLGRCDTVLLMRLRTPRDLEAADDMLEINIPDPRVRRAVIAQLANFGAGEGLLCEPSHLPTVNA